MGATAVGHRTFVGLVLLVRSHNLDGRCVVRVSLVDW